MGASGESPGAYPSVKIRKMNPADVSSIASILNGTATASGWTEENILAAAQSGIVWVAEEVGVLIGVLIGRSVTDEFEILNLAIDPSWRRRGVASQLLETMAEFVRSTGVRRAYLEVRASNEAAMALYNRFGFSPCGRRVRYYRYPTEDALLLSWDGPGTSC